MLAFAQFHLPFISHKQSNYNESILRVSQLNVTTFNSQPIQSITLTLISHPAPAPPNISISIVKQCNAKRVTQRQRVGDKPEFHGDNIFYLL